MTVVGGTVSSVGEGNGGGGCPKSTHYFSHLDAIHGVCGETWYVDESSMALELDDIWKEDQHRLEYGTSDLSLPEAKLCRERNYPALYQAFAIPESPRTHGKCYEKWYKKQ